MELAEIIEQLEEIFPERLEASGDVTGPQIMIERGSVTTIGVCYEVTDRVLEASADVDLLVAFHPLIFTPLRRITPLDRVGRCLISLVASQTPLFITHTRLDAHPRGTNRTLADRIGLTNGRPLLPNPLHRDEGMGIVGEYSEEITWHSLVQRVKEATGSTRIVASDIDGKRIIRRVAIVAGSGMSYYKDVIGAEVDAFITGDVKYHDFHASLDAVPIIDPGHAESERFVVESTVAILRDSGILDKSIEIVPITLDTRPGLSAGS